MFAMSRSDLAPAYTCGTYHRRGLKGCTSHHIRVDRLDELLKSYVRKLADSSAALLEQLNEELKRENDQVAETEQSADNLAAVLADLTEELKVTKRQRIREIMKKPEQEASIEALYDEMEADLQKRSTASTIRSTCCPTSATPSFRSTAWRRPPSTCSAIFWKG